MSVEVSFDVEASEASADDLEDFSSETVSFPAGAEDGTTRDVNVTVTPDDESEDTETATFALQNTTGGAEIGSPETFDLEIEDDDEAFTPVEVVALDCPAELETGEEGTFTATINESEATKPVSSEWEFGDGTTATGLEATKTYDTADSYTVTYTASNEGSEDSENCTVEVSEAGASGVIYVDADATGNDNGSTWENAYIHLQDALRNAEGDEEIWVAEGTYFPDWDGEQTTGDREDSFQLKSRVGLYGGFSGGETSRDQRDWSENETVLSGEINISDFPDDNSKRVVTASETNNAILDGFTVTKDGNGLYSFDGSPTVKNAFFANNQGNGVVNESNFRDDSGSPGFINCVFRENDVNGMRNIGEDITVSVENSVFYRNGDSGLRNKLSTLTVENGSFQENNGGMKNIEGDVNVSRSLFAFNETGDIKGGAIYNESELNDSDFANLTVTNTEFIGNSSTFVFGEASGGALANERDGSEAKVTGSLFVGNSSDIGGAISGNVRIVNSTFSGNTAEERGGAVAGNGEIFSSILWNNTADEGSQLDGDSFVRSSLIEGGLPGDAEDGGGNINANPLFVDADGPDNTLGTLDDNLRLQSDSPAIDAGTNEALDLNGNGDPTDDVPVDLDGDTRIQNGTVDMGAYEH